MVRAKGLGDKAAMTRVGGEPLATVSRSLRLSRDRHLAGPGDGTNVATPT